MKKLLLSVFLLVALSFSANAQDISENALGLRFGSGGTEITYQRGLSKNNRFEVDLGWDNHKYYSSFQLTGLYQWVWNIDGGFNWYAGAGASIGSYSHDDDYSGNDSDGAFGSLDGDIGVEYNFDIPLQLALDLRPQLYFGNTDSNFQSGNIALALRYRF